MDRKLPFRSFLVLLVATLVFAAAVPGVAAAETRAEGTTVVDEGETVNELTVFSGTVVVRGTVAGDLTALAGTVIVEETGVVTGSVSGAASTFRIDGRVDGDVSVAAAHVAVGTTGVVGRDLSAGAGDVRIDGRVGGDAALGSGDITIGSTAVIDGDVRYDRDATYVQEDGATVGGSVIAERSVATDVGLFVIPWWVGAVYATLASLGLGLVLLAVFPGTSRSIAEGVATEPLRSLGFGLATIVVVPVGLVVLALTIVGIPLSILGAVLFGFVAWMAMVWGRFAVAAYLLGRVDVEDRWIAMVVGVVGFGVVAAVPVVGGLVDGVIALLGMGALATTLLAARRRRREAVAEPETLPGERGPKVA